jgi:single-strand DNA-binding protein
MSFAKITIEGNLGNDPETKYTPNGTMLVEFSVAVNNWRKRDDPPKWYRVTAWRDDAERMDKLTAAGSLRKGSSVYIYGDLDVRTYQGNNGDTRVSLDVTFIDFEYAGGAPRKDDDTNDGPTSF